MNIPYSEYGMILIVYVYLKFVPEISSRICSNGYCLRASSALCYGQILLC